MTCFGGFVFRTVQVRANFTFFFFQINVPNLNISRPSFFPTMSESLYPTKPSYKHPPRRIILGGYVVDDDTCRAWGSRIAGISIPPEHVFGAFSIINNELTKKYKTKFTPVGSETHRKEWMVVTQSAKFNGWKDMDPALIPQFEEGYREEIARQLLEENGTCS